MQKDPVCGMDVEEASAAATSEYKGKTYYFCAQGCKEKFDQSPEKYLKDTPQQRAAPTIHEVEQSKDDERKGNAQKVILPITGMSCASCAVNIQKGLSQVKGSTAA